MLFEFWKVNIDTYLFLMIAFILEAIGVKKKEKFLHRSSLTYVWNVRSGSYCTNKWG